MTLFSEKIYISKLLNYKTPNITQEDRIKNSIKLIREYDNDNDKTNDVLEFTKFESLLFIKFGLTYHLNQGRPHLSPVSSVGTAENSLSDDEMEDYVNMRYSKSVSSPY